MRDTEGRDLEGSISSERVLAAHRLLIAQVPGLGLKLSHNSGHVKAVRLHDAKNRYLFSWIPAQQHLLFYVRRPALNSSPHVRESAFGALPRTDTNPRGEVTSKLEGAEDAKAVISWLSQLLPLP